MTALIVWSAIILWIVMMEIARRKAVLGSGQRSRASSTGSSSFIDDAAALSRVETPPQSPVRVVTPTPQPLANSGSRPF
jgi:hypothetical protein